jgi:hypothetical protein
MKLVAQRRPSTVITAVPGTNLFIILDTVYGFLRNFSITARRKCRKSSALELGNLKKLKQENFNMKKYINYIFEQVVQYKFFEKGKINL